MPLAFCAVRQAGRKWEKAGRSYLTQRNKPHDNKRRESIAQQWLDLAKEEELQFLEAAE
jgi:hypothetical protein